MLKGKKIVLGVTGSIAAYKSAMLVRLLVKQGAEVKVVMSESATSFITPLTLSVLSKNVVSTGFKSDNDTWNSHVELGLWGDVLLIAPASANTMAKMVQGICDNFLMACYLSAKCPVIYAPAMDRDMFLHPATQKNIEVLNSYHNILIAPNEGDLASGLQGKGRMAEPEEIVQFLQDFFLPQKSKLKNKTILINAGPTQEAIDPVRYISNHSSGKMGYAIAEEAANRGAKVILVSGSTQLSTTNTSIRIVNVISANEMAEACFKNFTESDIAILTAAVADYAPVNVSSQKLKKLDDTLTLELKKNIDIAGELGKRKKGDQLLVGFALETNNETENALGKMEKKNMDFIVLNSLNDKGAGFGSDTNKITVIHKNGTSNDFGLKSKADVAKDILDEIELLLP
jgi:phosphopantothenoylcysteine decarboxylase/phosphopantothenate--cysteine ligase